MSTWKRFEDIQAWQKARILAKKVYEIYQTGKLSKDWGLRDQMNRSSGSIMDNIAEGFDRGGNKEFIHFLSIAKGSTGELQSQLYRAYDRGYIDKETFHELYKEANLISAMIKKLIDYLKKSKIKGYKFKLILTLIAASTMITYLIS